MGGFLSYLQDYVNDPNDFYTPGMGYWPSVARRGLGDLFSLGKRGIDYLATESYKSEPRWDPELGRMVMGTQPGLENLETIPVEEMLTEAVAPEILSGDPQIPSPYQNLYNLGRAGLRTVGRFGLDPMVAPALNVPGKLGAGLAGIFGVEGGIGAYEKGKEALEAPNFTEAIEPGIESLSYAAMSALGGRHAGREIFGSRKPSIIPDTPEKITGPFEVDPNASVSAPEKISVLEDLILPEKAIPDSEAYQVRFKNMAEETLNRIKDFAAESLQDPGVKDIKVELSENAGPGGAFFHDESNTIYFDPGKLSELTNTKDIASTLLHEIAHRKALHDFPGVLPDLNKVNEYTPIDKLTPDTQKAYSSISEGKFAEVNPALAEHTVEGISERAKYSPEEHQFQTAQDALLNNPQIIEIMDKYAQNLKRLQSEEFARARGLEYPMEGTEPPALVSAPKPTGISEPANILRQVLAESKMTTFNKNTLLAELAARKIPVPEELKAEIPKLLEELKARGWVNEKIAGKMTLLVEPPKRTTEIGESKPVFEPVNTLEQQLKQSIVDVGEKVRIVHPNELRTDSRLLDRVKILREKNPDLSLKEAVSSAKSEAAEQVIDITPIPQPPKKLEQQMKEKLTKDEIKAIAKLFGGEEAKTEVPEEVKLAQEAAKKATGGKKKSDEDITIDVDEEAPKKSYKVTLSDGSEHTVKASSPEDATQKADSILKAGGSTKTVDKVEEKLGSLERAAKYEIDPLKKGSEEVTEDLKDSKFEAVAEEKAIEKDIKDQLKVEADYEKAQIKESAFKTKEQQKLEKAQTKEKLAKKSFEVRMSNNETYTVRARNEQRAKEYVENKIRQNKSNLTVQSVTEKLSKLDKALKGVEGKKPVTEPPKFGRESITDADNFTQAWGKLTPTEKVSEVMGIIKAMRSSGDLGHMLRQGKLMTVDFLTTGNAKKLVDALKTMKESTFSEQKFKEINEGHAQDPITSKLVEDFGLDLPGIGKHLKEEAFHAGTAEKIPGVGKYLIKPSERAYTSFLNEARVSEAKRLVKIAQDAGFTMEANPEVYKSLMKAVNIISSRGHFEKIGPTLNQLSNLMWAPRLKLSRAQLLATAAGAGEMHPLARAEIRKSLARTTAVNMSLLGLATLAGLNVETDPRNSDWGRIVVGKTRIDPWMGLQPIVRSAVLMHLGETVSATTGRTKPINPTEVVGRQFTSGIAPGPAYVYEQVKGKSITGFPIDKKERAILGLTPLLVEDFYEAFKEYGLIGGVGVGAVGFVGEGVSTYSENPNKKKKAKKKLPAFN